jgi:hypothetical protein
VRKLEQVLAIVEADRKHSAQTPLLRIWRSGELTVAVDASLRVILWSAAERAVIGDVCALVNMLSEAERFAAEARKLSQAALIA